MSNHGLTRTPDNEPVCLCGYRPDFYLPVSIQHLKAKTAILDHAKALNDAAAANEWEAALDALAQPVPTTPTPLRSPGAPFTASTDLKYPRAGVRLMASGKWLLSLWDGDQVLHVFDDPEFDDRKTAFDYGWLTIGACRQSGTNLNGMEAK
jgi:hypothetical protein